MAVRVVADVDGDVAVILTLAGDTERSADHIRAFEGTVDTPSLKIAVVTAENERILESDVPGKVSTALFLGSSCTSVAGRGMVNGA